VKFGVMTQIQMPLPWPEAAEVVAYRNAIEQAVAADALGFDYCWLTEMHFFREIGHSPCPEMIHAAIAERTTRIRLGFAVLLVTANSPFMIAERVASLDVLSRGRVDFGFGRGSSSYMVEPFGVEQQSSRAVALEAMAAIMQMFEHEAFPGFKGRYFDLPARHVVPRPVQRPHPPLWVAASNLETYATAARLGLGVIGVTRNPLAETRSAIRAYRESIRASDPAGFIGREANEHAAAFALACCHEDDRLGRDLACAAARWYNGDNDAELNRVRFTSAGGKDAVVAKFRARSNDELIADGMAIGGNPDSICRQVERWAEAGLDQIIFLLQAGHASHEQVLRSIELIGRHVIPHFAVAV
jgi:alkanesulfonate monooxygenase SsuD/methylene tetrahydromethanopterin reductase-like flavin-dependent oxidoreductase (luciferase family)